MKINNLLVCLSVLVAAAVGAIPQTASAEAFEGEYLGLQGGVSIRKTTGDSLVGRVDETDYEPTAMIVAGFRIPVEAESPVVVGVEGDVGAVVDGFDYRFGISGIAGTKIGDQALIYARAGYASQSGIPTRGPDATLEGLMLGGGVEYNLTKNLNLRVDYRHLDLGRTPLDGLSERFKVRSNEIAGGLIFDF